MATHGPIGSKLRELRMNAGLKQADLAHAAGISASYLNLIEHNRRRIGGKLLNTLAEALAVDVGLLTEGADADLVLALEAAAGRAEAHGIGVATPGIQHGAHEVAERYPDWARLIRAQQLRIQDLERVVETLTDRLGHDPDLASSLHDVLTTATAINSASSILTETQEIEPEWRERFHRNIREDSERLAQSSQALVRYLEGAGNVHSGAQAPRAPEEEIDGWLDQADHHLPALEDRIDAVADVASLIPKSFSEEAQAQAKRLLRRYTQDAGALPLQVLVSAVARAGFDPVAIAGQMRLPVPLVLRRLAALPRQEGRGRIGLAICDSSGQLTYRKSLGAFGMPRYGGACPEWPLFKALSQPMMPIRAVIETSGRDPTRYLAFAIAEPIGAIRYDAPPVLEATMLLLPHDLVDLPPEPVRVVGTNCRVFPCPSCQARRASA